MSCAGDPQADTLPDARTCTAAASSRLAEVRCLSRKKSLLPDARACIVRGAEARYSHSNLGLPEARCCWRPRSQVLLVVVVYLALLVPSSTSYKCHSYNDNSLGEILPRSDIIGHVNDSIEVTCNYNSTELGAVSNEVQFIKSFEGSFIELPSTRISNSSIRSVLQHTTNEVYKLYCWAENYTKPNLCHKQVMVGYPPMDVVDFRCVSPNWFRLNCTWTRPDNAIKTNYSFAYRVPAFLIVKEIIYNIEKNFFVIENFGTRENIIIVVTANNSLGTRNFTHHVNVYEVVVPMAAENLSVSAISTNSAQVKWKMHDKMDHFAGKLLQEVSWSVFPDDNWTVSIADAKYEGIVNKPSTIATYPLYESMLELPYASTDYRIRIRMHTAVGDIRDHMWSQPSYVQFTTKAKLPEKSAISDVSSFETSNFQLLRDVFVYWQQVAPLWHNGGDFHYRVMALNGNTGEPMVKMPVISNHTYAKFPGMNISANYKFEITAVNSEGAGHNSSFVVVPAKAIIPDTPEMFNVIIYKNPADVTRPIYRLIWKAPKTLGVSEDAIIGYTLFWCDRPDYDIRCEENLRWESVGPELSELIIKGDPTSPYDLPVLYERNMTTLPHGQRFGIAATTSTGVSSGIKWSTYAVPYDDSPPAPATPLVVVSDSRTVTVDWSFECRDKAAVPLAVNISYCEVEHSTSARVDFTSCTTPVLSVKHGLSGTAKIVNLRPSANMIVSLSVLSVMGASRDSIPTRVTMPEDVPSGPPELFTVVTYDNTTANVTWWPPLPDIANGVIIEYEVSTLPMTKAELVLATEDKGFVSLL